MIVYQFSDLILLIVNNFFFIDLITNRKCLTQTIEYANKDMPCETDYQKSIKSITGPYFLSIFSQQ